MAKEPQLTIKFDGGDADQHAVDMRLLGRSLVGFDKIISSGVILIMERRPPRRRERARLIIKAQEPRIGSHEIPFQLQDKYGFLALGWQLFYDTNGKIIWYWVKFVLEHFVVRKKESEMTLDMIIEIQKLHLDARDKSEDRLVSELAYWRRDAMQQVDKLSSAAIDASCAVGPSTRSVSLLSDASLEFVVDEPMADAIKARGELEVGDLQVLSLRADGWIYHSRLLNVAHPERPGRFIYAKVRDPLGETDGNVYADAARDKAIIQVQAKIARRGREIESIYIMDFCEKTDGAA